MANGIEYSPGITGKFLYRVRETYLRDHLAPLLAARATGAAKLDLALRGIALDIKNLGNRTQPGVVVLRNTYYADLHDLVRPANTYGEDLDDRTTLELKRGWVREQLVRLEDRRLIQRRERAGKRPTLIMLRDDGSGEDFDDPNGTWPDSYVTILGAIIATGEFATWGAPELSFYLAAMIAERYEHDHKQRQSKAAKQPYSPGGGSWWRPLSWFSDPDQWRPSGHILVPFSGATLERGLKSLMEKGLVTKRYITRDPMTGKRITSGRRNLYQNKFRTLSEGLLSDSQIDQFLREEAPF